MIFHNNIYFCISMMLLFVYHFIEPNVALFCLLEKKNRQLFVSYKYLLIVDSIVLLYYTVFTEREREREREREKERERERIKTNPGK